MTYLIPVFFLRLQRGFSSTSSDFYAEALEMVGDATEDPAADLVESLSTNWWHLHAINTLARAFDLPRVKFLEDTFRLLAVPEIADLNCTVEGIYAALKEGRKPVRPPADCEPPILFEELREALASGTEVRRADEASGHLISFAQFLVSLCAVCARAVAADGVLLYCQPQQ